MGVPPPPVKTTQQKVNNIILIGANTLMTWRENGFHKPPVRLGYPFSTHLQKSTNLNRSIDRLYISVGDGPTERISSFIYTSLQPIAQNQQSCIKDTTDFINFIEKTKIGQDAILVSMDVTSLYTNIPQEEAGTEIVCKAYELFHNNDPPIPTHYLRKINAWPNPNWKLIWVQWKQLSPNPWVAMGTKAAVCFANIYLAEIETTSSNKVTLS